MQVRVTATAGTLCVGVGGVGDKTLGRGGTRVGARVCVSLTSAPGASGLVPDML